MQALINLYAHGYVVCPVITACRSRGLFELLSTENPLSIHHLTSKLKANEGHLKAALRMFLSAGWLEEKIPDHYCLTPAAGELAAVPDGIESLLSFPVKDYLTDPTGVYSLGDWIELAANRWNTENESMQRMLDGMLIIPLLLTMKNEGFFKDGQAGFRRMGETAGREVKGFFKDQAWLQPAEWYEDPLLSSTGEYIASHILNTAVTASYQPVLAKMEELLFGDCKTVFEYDASRKEQHIDRTLNVRGSGFQHGKYFADLEQIVVSLFGGTSFAQQPRYIADMGCGDGSLLRKLHEIIRQKSPRGQVLDKFPLTLIGIDFNEAALTETARTLHGLDYMVIHGDINDPAGLMASLNAAGITDTEGILHVRSFLDHDRPFRMPVGLDAEAPPGGDPGGIYVDDNGSEISGDLVRRSLHEHLERWSSIINRHGLILLEVHCLEPQIVRRNFDSCENFHFDAYHSFSHQQLVKAETFLMAAAASGLILVPEFSRKYPKTMPYTRITLNYYQPKDFRISYAQYNDLPYLEQLEAACWPQSLRASSETIRRRLDTFPQGQLVMKIGGRPAGVIYSQRISEPTKWTGLTAENVWQLQEQDGPVLQLLALNIFPEMQDRNLGDQLLEFMLQKCRLINGIEKIIGVTRCRDHVKYQDLPFKEYMNLKDSAGLPVDPILRFHVSHGARIIGPVDNYRPKDNDNEGYGVLIAYDLWDIKQEAPKGEEKVGQAALPTSQNGSQGDTPAFIRQAVTLLLGKEKEGNFSLESPLMEMGLDSADLMELTTKINRRFGIRLSPSFFFEFNTTQKIIDHFDTKAETTFNEAPNLVAAGTAKLPEEDTGIAIVGISLKFPGGIVNKQQLWNHLLKGRDLIRVLPDDRWKWPDTIEPEGEHSGIDKGGFMDDIACFDASFFRISPKEALTLDVQQRLLLEITWECLEDAGISPASLAGRETGVFIGASGSDYRALLQDLPVSAHFGTGTSLAALANRISYFYDLNGPSIQIDTACSSSLVAVHEAVRSLRTGECDLALAGAVHIMCHPAHTVAYYKAGMLSPEGKCHVFDRKADGYVRGEGVAMIALKPVKAALADHDRIYAVIRGSAVNHGGLASGFTVPSPQKQAALLIKAFRDANIAPETIGYIEAHGTGTPLGDPIEVNGLARAFAGLATRPVRPSSCGLGSIKSNIGHLEAAAGLAGLIKATLCLQHATIVPTLNYTSLNPEISLEGTPFYITEHAAKWDQDHEETALRRAGVSSFGSGGTNAHIVLEEAPAMASINHKDESPWFLITLSARNPRALKEKAIQLANWLDEEGKNYSLTDICASLFYRREHFKTRSAYVIAGKAQLVQALSGRPEQGQSPESDAQLKTMQEWAAQYENGQDLPGEKIFGPRDRLPHIDLPFYPFSKDRYWIDWRSIPVLK